MNAATPPHLLAAIERNRRRLWALCYRMTGRRADADDLSQEAIARAIARATQLSSDDPTGWLLAIAARTCLDHLRRARVRRRTTELVDPLLGNVWPQPAREPEQPDAARLRRDELRFAVVVALQALSPRQRAVLVLRDVCELPAADVAMALGTNENAVKALLHRARAALAAARHHVDLDAVVDEAVVRRFAEALESGSLDAITKLFADDVWGVVDDPARPARKPTFGLRAVSRQWANAKRRFPLPVVAEIVTLNGEPAVVVRLSAARATVIAIIHVETRAERIKALRVIQDPTVIAALQLDS